MSEVKFASKCRYKVKVISSDGEVTRESGWSPNMVLDSGVAALFNTPSIITIRPVVGSGNSPVEASQTRLASFVAGSTSQATSVSTVRNISSPPYYVMHSLTWRFAAGAAAGNLAEVGVTVSGATSTSDLFSRALIVDGSGNPTTITVLSDEYLDVTYEFYIYAPEFSSGSFGQMIDGSPVPTAYTIGPALMQSSFIYGWSAAVANGIYPFTPVPAATAGRPLVSSGAISDHTAGITGTTYNFTSAGWDAPYNASGMYRDARYTIGLDEGNTSISAIQLNCRAASFQMSISPPVNKINTKTYSLVIRYTLSRSP